MLGKGYTFSNSDVAVAKSGVPVVVYGVNIVSNSGGNGRLILRNGTTSGDTAVITVDGTTSTGTLFDFGGAGVVFPAGCFADKDANIDAFTVIAEVL